MKVTEIVNICNGYLYCGDENVYCSSFTKDTRTLERGDTYIGIKGEKFDGNAFYKDAISKGAIALILEEDYIINNNIPKEDTPIIVVKNSLETLKDLAIYKRNKTLRKIRNKK